LAIETESGGIFEESTVRRLPAITIRGISDYADLHKNALENSSRGLVRHIAAANAASFLKLQLANRRFADVIAQYRQQRNVEQTTSSCISTAADNDVMCLVQQIEEEVDSKLRELSPEYRLQPKGYRLPIPRVRHQKYTVGIDKSHDSDPIEVREALTTRTLILTVPRNYPDNSLAWVLADELLTSEISGKQIIPVVVDANAIRPPNPASQMPQEMQH